MALVFVSIVGAITAFQFCKPGIDFNDRPASQLVNTENIPVDFDDFKGKIVLVNNWASWCAPCIAEMPSIQQLKSNLKGEAIDFVMVSFDEDPNKAIAFMRVKDFDLDVYFPGKNYPYSTSSIPVTFVLDKKGNVVFKHEGMFDYTNGEFVSKLRALMAQ